MKEKILKERSMKRLLSVVLILVMVFTAIPVMDITAMAATTTTKPVTVVSARPENGNGFDTKLTFTKSVAGDAKEYEYCVSYSKAYYESLLLLKQKYDPELTVEELLYSDLSDGYWFDIPEDAVTVNLGECYSNYKYMVENRGMKPVENPVAVWVCEKPEASFDLNTCYEATSELKYIPGVSNTWILPDLFFKEGGTPITSYNDPNGQYTAKIQWYEIGEEDVLLAEDAKFKSTSTYSVKVKITLGEGYGQIEEYTEFYFGATSVYSEYEPELDYQLSFDLGKPYTPDQYEIMAVRYNIGNFDIAGKFDGKWKKTSYGNYGFETYLYVGEEIENNYESAGLINASAEGVTKDGLTVKINFEYLNDGQVLKAIYTVKNDSGQQKTFSLGSGADVQIGSSDDAIVTPFTDGSGFSMVSTSGHDKDANGNAAQLNFWCQNAKGVTDVDHFWYGAYGDWYNNPGAGYLGSADTFLSWYNNEVSWYNYEVKAIFTALPENRLSASDASKWSPGESLDSAMAWSWTDRVIKVGETQTYSVLFAVGAPGSENLVSGDFTNLTQKQGTITYSGDLEFNVTSIMVDGVVISSDAYIVNQQNKTITFKASAGLDEGKTVVVTLGETPISVRNNIKNNTPEIDDEEAPVVSGIESNKTYCEAKEFTVTDENLDVVKLDDTVLTPSNGKYTLPADGKSHTVVAKDKAGNTTTITSVKASDGHDFSGEWKVTKQATESEEGKKETICKNGCGTKKVEVIPATGEKEDSSEGKIGKDAEVAADAPVDGATLDNSKSEIMDASGIFTTEEKAAIEGGTEAKVYVTISNIDTANISAADKDKIEKAVEKAIGENSTIKYMDISLFKKVGTNDAASIHEPGIEMEITVEIPSNMLIGKAGMVRKYRILRIHDGVVETILGSFDSKTNELTFKTDKFSTYAIAYSDENVDIVIKTPNDNTTITKKDETLQLNVTVTPAEDASQAVTFTSSDEKVVTVDANGKVTAVGNGTATITVKTADGSVSKEVKITVKIADGNDNKVESPVTGDESKILLWCLLIVTGFVGSGFSLFYPKKRRCVR